MHRARASRHLLQQPPPAALPPPLAHSSGQPHARPTAAARPQHSRPHQGSLTTVRWQVASLILPLFAHPPTSATPRLAAAQAALHSEHLAATQALAAERAQLKDVTGHLSGELARVTARAEGAETALAAAQAALAAAQAAAASAAADAEARRATDVGAVRAQLEAQAERVAAADAHLAQRDGLLARCQALEAALEEEKRGHTKRQLASGWGFGCQCWAGSMLQAGSA